MRRIVVLAALLACKPAPAGAPRPPAALAAPAPAPLVAAAAPAAAPAPRAPDGDLDRDGVPDSSDRCPDEPEDRDQSLDQDGCVDRDNDGDSYRVASATSSRSPTTATRCGQICWPGFQVPTAASEAAGLTRRLAEHPPA